MIKLLDAATINKIAAGEVIERPSSVVKELVENSIDAKSRKISVEIKDGGMSFIRITDNGTGISESDVEAAFLSHATSKIGEITDLNTISTLGFRGEALASIAAVSQLEVVSKTDEQSEGVSLELFGGEILRKSGTACNTGTSITMRNLFYNTPVRKKFLKSPAAETSHIYDFINKIALSRPEISFRLISNGMEVLFTSGDGVLKNAIFSVYGMEYAENVLDVEYESGGVSVSGYVGKQEICRTNRAFEDIFVNGRYVKDKIISRAAEDAYKTYLTVNKFPAFVLNVTTGASSVDVNAHPQKLEIRFSEEAAVYNAVYEAVLQALRSVVLVHGYGGYGRSEFPESAPIQKPVREKPPENVTVSEITYDNNTLTQSFVAREACHPLDDFEAVVIDKPVDITRDFTDYEKKAFERLKDNESERAPVPKNKLFVNYSIVGQVFSTYWLIEEDGRLYIIDQHAAHERILFEKTKESLQNSGIVSQPLLIPERLSLSEAEKSILRENIDYFTEIGFEFEEQNDEISLVSLPVFLKKHENGDTVRELLDVIENTKSPAASVYDLKLDALSQIACKAAVKGNDKISEAEARAVIEALLALENPFNCPHGRPTVIEITKKEVEVKFKRV